MLNAFPASGKLIYERIDLRAKKAIILVGSKKAIGCAVSTADVVKRNTGLAKRMSLNEKLNSV